MAEQETLEVPELFKLRIVNQPKPEWNIDVLPNGGFRMMGLPKAQVPNAFHRWMFSLVFGWKWERVV